MNGLLRGRSITLALCVVLVGIGILVRQWKESSSKASQLSTEVAGLHLHAAQGDAETQNRLGDAYFHGVGVKQDFTMAFHWYQESARQGNARGLSGLANMYYLGRGVQQDYAQAVILFQKAANEGDPHGEDGLALMYLNGRGVRQDFSAAYRLLQKAANQGYAKAEYNLGNLYYYGQGVGQDRDEAKRLYQAAANQDDEYALRVIGAEFTPLKRAILILQFLAGVWLALHFFATRSSRLLETGSAQRIALVISAGVLGALCAALVWYGYAHHKVHYLSYGIDTFNATRWLTYVILVTMLVRIVSLKKKA